MPKVDIKKGRTKSYEEKLRERQERMNLIDRQETVFMPGEDLSDNDEDEDAPLEVQTKKEILPLVDEDLPEIKLQPKKSAKKKKEKIKQVASGEFVVKSGDADKLTIKTPKTSKWASRNKMSFREQLLKVSTKNIRPRNHGHASNNKHIDKWSKKRVA